MHRRYRPLSPLERMQRRSAPALRPLLEHIAQVILSRAPVVIGTCVAAGQSPVTMGGYLERPDIVDRAWRFTYEGERVFCIMERASQSLLVSWLTAGRKRDALSPIEDSIVAACVQNMLSTDDRKVHVAEELRTRPLGASWRCDVTLRDAQERMVTLHLYACIGVYGAPPPFAGRPSIMGVPLTLRAVLPAMSRSLTSVRAWHPGYILPVSRASADVTVTIIADSQRIALAQLGAVQERRAIRMITLGALS